MCRVRSYTSIMHWAHIRRIMELCASSPPLCRTVQFKGLLKSVAKGGKVRVDTLPVPCIHFLPLAFDDSSVTPGELRRNRWAGVKNRAGSICLIIHLHRQSWRWGVACRVVIWHHYYKKIIFLNLHLLYKSITYLRITSMDTAFCV